MSKSVEFLFDFGSPATYLAYTQLPKIAERAGAEIVYTPILLGGVFKATGNRSPVSVQAKGVWMLTDLVRWADRYGVPFALNPHFPINTLYLMRGAVAYRDDERFGSYLEAVFRAMWVDGVNLGDTKEAGRIVAAAGIDPGEFLEAISTDAVKDALRENTEQAVVRGVFGAPTFFTDGGMVFGQDRLGFVAEDLGTNFP